MSDSEYENKTPTFDPRIPNGLPVYDDEGNKVGEIVEEEQPVTGTALIVRPPDAPDDLNDNEAVIWKNILSELQPGWIGPESYHQLKAYIRHTIYADTIAGKIDDLMEAGLSIYNAESIKTMKILTAIHREETKSIASIATKLRLTNQSLIHRDTTKEKAKKQRSIRDTWVDDDEDENEDDE